MSKNFWFNLFNKKKFHYNKLSLKTFQKNNLNNLIIDLQKVITPLNNKAIKHYYSYLTALLRPIKSENILDFGSGNGAFALHLKNNFYAEIVCIEVSKPLIEFQKKKLGLNVFKLKKNNFKLNFPDNYFHKLIANNVTQYFKSKKFFEQQLNEMIRVTKSKIVLSGILNVKYQKKFEKKQMKSENLSEKKYKNKFKNYQKLYFERKNFHFLLKNQKVEKYFFKEMPRNFLYPGCGIFSLVINLSKKNFFS